MNSNVLAHGNKSFVERMTRSFDREGIFLISQYMKARKNKSNVDNAFIINCHIVQITVYIFNLYEMFAY